MEADDEETNSNHFSELIGFNAAHEIMSNEEAFEMWKNDPHALNGLNQQQKLEYRQFFVKTKFG